MSQEPRQSSDLSARRRLLRGAFSVPAVLTVSSGRALAQTSSAARCIASQVDNDITGLVTTTYDASQPGLVRVRLYALIQNGNGNILSYWLRGIDLQPYGGSAFLGSTQFQQFDLPNNRLVPYTVSSQQPSKSSPPHSFGVANQYVALRFDATGKVVGVGATGGAYPSSAIYHSCWSSFA